MATLQFDAQRIAGALQEFASCANRPWALTGFDGYIDKLVRPRRSQAKCEYFNTVSEFADFIKSKGAASSDIAVHRVFEKIGGNGTLLGQALAEKSVPTACIGAMGDEELAPAYRELAEKMELYSVCRCATCYAFEFNDGKLMFGDAESFEEINWARVEERLGVQKLKELFSRSELMCFTNWSGLPHSTDLLEGIIEEICPILDHRIDRCIYFDLADPSGKSNDQFAELFSALSRLRKYYHTVVGLNPKECLYIYDRYFGRDAGAFSPALAQALLDEFPSDELVVHVPGGAYAGLHGGSIIEVKGRFLQKPRLSVGAGDNFNSGYCLGKLIHLPPCDCAALGNESATIFMERSLPAKISELIAAFKSYGDTNIK